MPYPVIDVSGWRVAGWEREGTTEHPWLERPGDDDERLWLFKEVIIKNGHRQAEDWVEKVSSVVAGALARRFHGRPSASAC